MKNTYGHFGGFWLNNILNNGSGYGIKCAFDGGLIGGAANKSYLFLADGRSCTRRYGVRPVVEIEGDIQLKSGDGKSQETAFSF